MKNMFPFNLISHGHLLLTFSLFVCYFSLNAQQSGNSVHGTNYTYGKQSSSGKLSISDSSFVIEGSVLINVIADEYVVTFGLSEESPTLKEGNEKIEKRIRAFKADLMKMGVKAADIYVDMTTQNKIYDFKINDAIAEEYLQGFELKKNVIVRFKNIIDLDKMIIAASDHQIYDLVKVDYLVSNMQAVYDQLFNAAMEVINHKKDLYAKATNSKILPESQIYSEDYYSYYPSQLYKSYTAHAGSDVYIDKGTVKEIRKSPTFYYDKANYSGFDKVINPAVTEPAVEFVLVIQVMFRAR